MNEKNENIAFFAKLRDEELDNLNKIADEKRQLIVSSHLKNEEGLEEKIKDYDQAYAQHQKLANFYNNICNKLAEDSQEDSNDEEISKDVVDNEDSDIIEYVNEQEDNKIVRAEEPSQLSPLEEAERKLEESRALFLLAKAQGMPFQDYETCFNMHQTEYKNFQTKFFSKEEQLSEPANNDQSLSIETDPHLVKLIATIKNSDSVKNLKEIKATLQTQLNKTPDTTTIFFFTTSNKELKGKLIFEIKQIDWILNQVSALENEGMVKKLSEAIYKVPPGIACNSIKEFNNFIQEEFKEYKLKDDFFFVPSM